MSSIPVPTWPEMSQMFNEAFKKIGNRCDLFEPLPSPPKIKRATSPVSHNSEGFAPSPKEDTTVESLKTAIPGWNPEEMTAQLDSYFKHNPEHPSAGVWAEVRTAQEKHQQKTN